MNLLKNKSGETILEIIFALGILAIAITMATDFITGSIRNVNNGKERVIAVNLAREGIEAMRDLRDTNWLRYSSRRQDCWNHNPEVGLCDGTTPISPGTYTIYRHTSGEWRIGPTLIPDSPNPDIDATELNWVDYDSAVDSDGDGTTNNDVDMYNHFQISGAIGFGNPQKTTGSFYRTIQITYLADDGTVPGALGPQHNRMIVESTVTWNDGNHTYNVKLQTVLTDHLGRNENFS